MHSLPRQYRQPVRVCSPTPHSSRPRRLLSSEPMIIHTAIMNLLRSDLSIPLCLVGILQRVLHLREFFVELQIDLAKAFANLLSFAIQGPDFIIRLRLVLVRLAQARLLPIVIFLQVPRSSGAMLRNIPFVFSHQLDSCASSLNLGCAFHPCWNWRRLSPTCCPELLVHSFHCSICNRCPARTAKLPGTRTETSLPSGVLASRSDEQTRSNLSHK